MWVRASSAALTIICVASLISPALAKKTRQVFATPNRLTAADIDLLSQAALNAGVDPGIVVRMAAFESNFNPNARPPQVPGKTRSAHGYGQFINKTWHATLVKYGDQYGITGASQLTRAQAIDPQYRNNRALQAAMLAELTRDNLQTARQLGGSDDDANVYAMHNLGEPDAPTFLNALKSDPAQPVSSVLSQDVISNNPSLYGDGTISVEDSYNRMGSHLDKHLNKTIPTYLAPDPGTQNIPPVGVIAPDLIPLERATQVAALPGGVSLSRAAAERMALNIDLDAAFSEEGRLVLSGKSSKTSTFDASLLLTSLRLACEGVDPYFSLDPDDGPAWVREGDAASTELFEIIKRNIELSGDNWASRVPKGLRFHAFSAKRDYARDWARISPKYPNLKTRLVFKPDWLRETRFGEIFYVADVLLKELSSGLPVLRPADKQARVLAIDGYVSAKKLAAADHLLMTVDGGRASGSDNRGTRFWFDLVERSKSKMRSMLDDDPIILKAYEPTTPVGRGLKAQIAKLWSQEQRAHPDLVRRVSMEQNAADLSQVYPTMFIVGHDNAADRDLNGDDPFELAVSNDVNERMEKYVAAYEELRQLTDAFRLYVAAVAVVKRQSGDEVCRSIKAMPLLPSEKVATPLPEFHPSELTFTVATYRADKSDGGYTSWWGSSNYYSGGVSPGGIDLYKTAETKPTAVTSVVRKETTRMEPVRKWSGKSGRDYVALLLAPPGGVPTQPTAGVGTGGGGMLDDDPPPAPTAPAAQPPAAKPSAGPGMLDDVDPNATGVVTVPRN